jgi:putative transposase
MGPTHSSGSPFGKVARLECGGRAQRRHRFSSVQLQFLLVTRFYFYKLNIMKSASQSKTPTFWPHAPVHRLSQPGTYFVTAGTYGKLHHFNGPERMGVLHRGLLRVMQDAGWQLEAWAAFPNHYHFVAHSPAQTADAHRLSHVLGLLHEKTAKWVNRLDGTKGRQVWHNFRDTRLTHEPSYLARLNYCHQNAVKHGVVRVASDYPWCSAAWFERSASRAQVQTVYGFKIDKVSVQDDYDVEGGGLPA